jgi:predicted TIM-barrel fold metal-dependent hydrolase
MDLRLAGGGADGALSDPLAHMGGVRFHEFALFGLVRRFAWYPRNVWCDLSAVAAFYADSPYSEQLVWVIRAIGTDRVLFGSDWPVDAPAKAVAAVQALGLTRAEQAQILYANAAALLGLTGAERPVAGDR